MRKCLTALGLCALWACAGEAPAKVAADAQTVAATDAVADADADTPADTAASAEAISEVAADAVAVADAATAEAVADAVIDAVPMADAATAADVGPDAAVEVVAETAAEVSADAAPATGLTLTVQGNGLAAATLYIFALPVAELASPGGPKPATAVILAQLPAIKPPWTGNVALAKGSWVLGAMLSKGGFDPFQATGVAFGCADAKPWPITSDGSIVQPPNLTLQLTPPEATPPIASLCGTGGGSSTGAPQGMLSEAFQAAPPSTQAGGAHLLDGRYIGGKYWVAGHQDGWVSFDLSPGATPLDLADWKTQGQGLCSRLGKVSNRLWCTTRRPVAAWALVNTVTGVAGGFGTVQVQSGELLDGVAQVQDRAVFAAHGAGLVSLSADPPFAELPLTYTATLVDPWDVAAVGTDTLVVADGAGGLKILAVSTNPLQLQQVATVALPGLAGWLAVTGKQVLVGSPSGFVHIVDVTTPNLPLLQGQLLSPWPVWGMTAVGNLGFAAAGAVVWAFDLPKPGVLQGKLAVRAAERSWHYALDVDPFGPAVAATTVLTAEFAAIRLLDIDPKVLPGPIVVPPKAVYSKPVAVGVPIKTTVTLRNFGPASVLLTDVLWLEDPKGALLPAKLAVPGLPLTVAANGALTLQLQATKTLKGMGAHLIKLQTPLGEHVLQLQEVTALLPGDPLPALAYQDGAKKLVDVNAALAGKPGVVMVAAHACPVALASLAALVHALQPLVAQGKVAAVAIDPWDKPDVVPEMAVITANFPILFSPLTTADSHAYSALLQDILAQPTNNAAPMPVVYVVDKNGVIVDARQGWEPAAMQSALAALGVVP